MMRLIAVLIALTTLSACTWVKVNEAGQSVTVLETVLESGALSSCKPVGKVTAISRAKIAGISRKEKKLSSELEAIARNEAATMGGNAISALGQIDGNERIYQVYKCD